MGRAGQFWLFQQNFKGPYLGKYFTKYAIIWQIFFSDHIDQMCKLSSKSGEVPFQISFFLGDLTRNDPTQETVMSSVCCIFSSLVTISFFKSLSQVFALRMLQKCFFHKLVIFHSPIFGCKQGF